MIAVVEVVVLLSVAGALALVGSVALEVVGLPQWLRRVAARLDWWWFAPVAIAAVVFGVLWPFAVVPR